MPQLGLEAANRTVANVPRSFFCAKKNRGVTTSECQGHWLAADPMLSFVDSHKDCINRCRMIALAPYDRRDLDPMQRAVWEYLKTYGRGIENVKTSEEIRRELSTEGRGAFSISDDKLRQCVREMKAKGYCIVSSNVGRGIGFFMPLRNEEILNFLRTQASRRDAIMTSMKETSRFLHCSPEKLAELGLESNLLLETAERR